MKKKVSLLIGVVLLIGLIWYLFIKDYDYQVNFKVATDIGTTNQTIKAWDISLKNSEILEKNGLEKVVQKIQSGDSIIIYTWKITKINDSTSQVKVFVKDQNHSLKNKILIPFSDTSFEKETRKKLLTFNEVLHKHLNSIRVKIIGMDELRSSFCAYISLKGVQTEKAKGMMANYPALTSIIGKNNIKLSGIPFLEITRWNKENDSIYYNFCMPIKKTDSLVDDPAIKYKNFVGRKAIKAIYNGNYITSDRAWYALLNYAQQKEIAVEEKPVEIFLDNPEMGGNELDWRAEIYLPLKDKDE